MKNKDYSLVIPVLNIKGNPYLQAILDTLASQSHLPKDVHIVAGDKRQGRAINFGVSKVTTTFIATVDDDTEIDDKKLFEKLLNAISSDDTIGMAGSACLIPEHASKFQKRAMREIPRRFFPIQNKNVDSDMVQHPCLVMKKTLFEEINGEDEDLVRGLDPVLRQKVRDAGKRVTVIADTGIYHLIPDSLWKVIKMYYRNGRGSGFALRNYPDRILELTDGKETKDFVKKRPLYYRIIRRFISTLLSLLSLKFIKLLTDIAYIIGVIKEKIYPEYILEPPAIEKIETEKSSKDYPFNFFIHRVFLKK